MTPPRWPTRRRATCLLALHGLLWPRCTWAQGARPALLVYLAPTPVEGNPPRKAMLDALHAGLRERGLQAGRDYTLVVKSADGRNDRYPVLVREALVEGAQVLIAAGSTAAAAARDGVAASARKVPVVFVAAGNLESLNLVQTLARPGGWLTGRTAVTQQLDPKRLELLRELLPRLKKLAVLAVASGAGAVSTTTERALAALKASAPEVDVQVFALREGTDLTEHLAQIRRARPDALLLFDQAVLLAAMQRIVDFAADARLPLMAQQRDWVDAGALISYGPSNTTEHRLLATQVAKVMAGQSPSEIPVEQPTHFDLVINGATARALKLTIPAVLAVRAEVLQ